MENLLEIVHQFAIAEPIVEVCPLGDGLINDTYKVYVVGSSDPKYVLQRINHQVFPDVDLLQNNIETVTQHIKCKLQEEQVSDLNRRVLQLVHTRNGQRFLHSNEAYWRMMLFIPQSVTISEVNPESAYNAGKAFGAFESMLTDLTDPIGEVIPNFHNIEFRLTELQDAIQADSKQRYAEVRSLVDDIFAEKTEMCKGEQLHRAGLLPKRICHCDTKVNNMLFDPNGEFLCVIDLDTVMPNFVFSDYGDFLRTAASTAAEDERDLSRIDFNMEVFKHFTLGFLEGTASFLLPIEREHLPYAAQLFPYMQCVRFLTDYLNGDVYYKTNALDHNLVRAKAQWQLFKCIKKKETEMSNFLKSF